MPWPTLRICQQEAVDRYMADRKGQREWLAMLTLGAGKTIFALYVAATLKQMGVIYRVAVFVPSDSLRRDDISGCVDQCHPGIGQWLLVGCPADLALHVCAGLEGHIPG